MKYTSNFQNMITLLGRLSPTRSVITKVSRISLSSGRQVSSADSVTTEQKQMPSQRFPGFDPVFVSPHIRQLRIACRLKIYQTGFVVCLLPASTALLQQGYIMPSHVGYVTGILAQD